MRNIALFTMALISMFACVEDIEESSPSYGIDIQLEEDAQLQYMQSKGEIIKTNASNGYFIIQGNKTNTDFLQVYVPKNLEEGTHILGNGQMPTIVHNYYDINSNLISENLYGTITLYTLKENPLRFRADFTGTFVSSVWQNGVWVTDSVEVENGKADIAF